MRIKTSRLMAEFAIAGRLNGWLDSFSSAMGVIAAYLVAGMLVAVVLHGLVQLSVESYGRNIPRLGATAMRAESAGSMDAAR
jgi:hypothetical protein